MFFLGRCLTSNADQTCVLCEMPDQPIAAESWDNGTPVMGTAAIRLRAKMFLAQAATIRLHTEKLRLQKSLPPWGPIIFDRRGAERTP
jgi:hypothetical protein